jgi:pimeloyl-ACP methyl ester carboxylesterase
MPFARRDGPDLYFEVSGSGPRLLFINGSGLTLEDAGLITAVLASRFEVLAYDYRGLGRSGEVSGGYTMAECATDAVCVLDAAGWPSAPVVGISFGGMVALELVVSHPERVERLVLLCTSAGGRGGSSFPLHELEDLDPPARDARRRTLMDTRFDQAWLDSHPDDRRLVAMMEARAPAGDHPRQRGFHEQLQARRTHDTWDRLATITCPTFIGCGRYDGIAPLQNSEAMASEIPGAELHVYPGGHAFLAQAPTSFEDITSFLLAAPV